MGGMAPEILEKRDEIEQWVKDLVFKCNHVNLQLSIKDKENKLMEYSLLKFGITSASILFKEI